MIADDRGSQKVLRSFAILWSYGSAIDHQCVESPKFSSLHEYFSNQKPMFPSVLKLAMSSPSGLKEEINLLAAKFPSRCRPCCLLQFSREHNARVHLKFPLTEMYGYSRLCDRLRSSAIVWKQLSLRSSAILIVCDHMETSLYVQRSCGIKFQQALHRVLTDDRFRGERFLNFRCETSRPGSARKGGGGGSGIPVYPKKIRQNTPKYPKFIQIYPIEMKHCILYT